MKYPLFVAVSLLSSCFPMEESLVILGSSSKKQKHKIALLQKKLQSSEKEKEAVEKQIEETMREIKELQLALIRKKIDDYEEKKGERAELFKEEREALYEIVQTGPSPQAFEAQVELDRILRMITELGDEQRI